MTKPIRDAASFVGVSLLKANGQEIATTTGSAVDLGPALYQSCVFVADLTSNDNPTGDTHDLTIEGSNDNSTWETVATFAQWDLNTSTGLIRVDFDNGKGPKRYYRYVGTQSTNADVTYSVLVVGMEPSQAPITQV
jgi:hypothetical protein